jgi:D-serine deaminase-like pyridoxal phosphate-dependent protein
MITASDEKLRNLRTPALVIDVPLARRNIERLAKYAANAGIRVRPHTKTHKLRELARMQLEAGAIGITVAKTGEAEAISDPGQDLLMAYPPVGVGRAERLAALARDRTVRAAVDSPAAIDSVSNAARAAGVTIGMLVDLDVGMHRTGVPTPADTLPLAQAIDRAQHVRLEGIMIYPGHVDGTPVEQVAELQRIDELVRETIELWHKHGLQAAIISGGSTPTAYQSHHITRQTEIRPGTYVFNDMNTVRGGYVTVDDCAARVLATVVSDAVPGQVVIDSGSKTLAADRYAAIADAGFGHVVEYPDARITRLTEEHAQVDVRNCTKQPKVGDRVTVIPNHICPCVNLQPEVWWYEPDDTLRRMEVDARGRIQ